MTKSKKLLFSCLALLGIGSYLLLAKATPAAIADKEEVKSLIGDDFFFNGPSDLRENFRLPKFLDPTSYKYVSESGREIDTYAMCVEMERDSVYASEHGKRYLIVVLSPVDPRKILSWSIDGEIIGSVTKICRALYKGRVEISPGR